MKIDRWWTKHTNALIFGGAAAWGLLLISCTVTSRTALAPPKIPGATFVGSKDCAQCHEEKVHNFGTSAHSRLTLSENKRGETGCESCHGPGSLHTQSGGARGTIVNPAKSPEACFACHLDKRGQFSLPSTHPVLAGHVTCVDCHDVHTGNAIKGSGLALEGMNETCTRCHTAQKGPFVFEHKAMNEGCIACHNPHGSVNQKMLVARDANLCLRCHLESPVPGAANLGQLNPNTIAQAGHSHNSDIQRGTCWSAGCHESPHGSNTDNLFRR